MIDPSDLTEEMIEELNEFLMSDDIPEDSLQLSDLDGFLTGIVVGPELIMPSEWVPFIWGGDEPVFDDEDQADRIMGIIMARYNQIILQLDGGQGSVEPIVYWAPDNNVIVADWAAGFMDALGLRADAWKPLLNDKESNYLMLPLLALTSDVDRELLFEGTQKQAREIIEESAGSLPDIIMAIYDYWKERIGAANDNTLTFGKKVGRNEPCPCGSGRKYKRCCGAN